MQMFLRQQIDEDDPRLDAVDDHFRANLLAIADAGHRAGATTLLCTVLANERDFAPFLSRHRAGLPEGDSARWQAAFTAAENAERLGNHSAAEKAYRAALAIDDRYAELHFRLGRLALSAGRDDDARGAFRRALDLDTLRFRTDSRLNDAIRDLGKIDRPGLAVVDLARDLAARSPHGILGDELLYEHVHLNLRGTYEAACDLFPRIAADLVRSGLTSGPPPAPPGYDEMRQRLAFSTHEQAMIALSLLARFRAAPFTNQSDNAARVAAWERISSTANGLLTRPDALPALREIYRQSMALAPDDWILARNAGAMLVARQAPAEALPLLQRAAAWIDDDIDTLVALGWAQRAVGQTADADATFGRARRLEPHYPGLPN
jgi:Tfp pilus assembly protein PilF